MASGVDRNQMRCVCVCVKHDGQDDDDAKIQENVRTVVVGGDRGGMYKSSVSR